VDKAVDRRGYVDKARQVWRSSVHRLAGLRLFAATRSSSLRLRSIRRVCRRPFPFTAVLRCRRASRGGRAGRKRVQRCRWAPGSAQPCCPLSPDHQEARIGENRAVGELPGRICVRPFPA